LNPEERREEAQAVAALYALGALSQHEARAFEAQLAESAEQPDEELFAFKSVVASLGLSAFERSPSASLREKLLNRVTAESEKNTNQALTASAAPPFSIRANDREWEEVAPGVFVTFLSADKEKGMVTSLLKLQPGAKFERHLHHSAEQCFVLEGDFWANGERLGKGDFHVALPGSIHESITTENGSLALIIAQEQFIRTKDEG
jgi:anti-sigma factor ChrR (cupin superfamily)